MGPKILRVTIRQPKDLWIGFRKKGPMNAEVVKSSIFMCNVHIFFLQNAFLYLNRM